MSWGYIGEKKEKEMNRKDKVRIELHHSVVTAVSIILTGLYKQKKIAVKS